MSSAGQGKVQVRELAPSAGYHCNPLTITVYGCPVIDLRPPATGARHKAMIRGGLRRSARHCQRHDQFRSNVHLYSCCNGEFVIFGHCRPRKASRPGGKYPVPFAIRDTIPKTTREKQFVRLSPSELRLGGGGPNVLKGFYNIFDRSRVQSSDGPTARRSKDGSTVTFGPDR